MISIPQSIAFFWLKISPVPLYTNMSTNKGMPLLRSRNSRVRQRYCPAHQLVVKEAEESSALYRERIKLPFRFMDLPVELRDMVYSYHAAAIQDDYELIADTSPQAAERRLRAKNKSSANADPTKLLKAHGGKRHSESIDQNQQPEERRSLACLTIAPLAQVSRDIRRDFLLIVFKEGAFDIIVGTTRSRHVGVLETIGAASSITDPIYLRPHVSELMTPATLFQHVRFVNFARYRTRTDRWRRLLCCERGDEKVVRVFLPLSFSLKWRNRQLDVRHGTYPDLTRYTLDRIGHSVKPLAIQLARDISAQEDFKGFSVNDLRRIANAMFPHHGFAG